MCVCVWVNFLHETLMTYFILSNTVVLCSADFNLICSNTKSWFSLSIRVLKFNVTKIYSYNFIITSIMVGSQSQGWWPIGIEYDETVPISEFARVVNKSMCTNYILVSLPLVSESGVKTINSSFNINGVNVCGWLSICLSVCLLSLHLGLHSGHFILVSQLSFILDCSCKECTNITMD